MIQRICSILLFTIAVSFPALAQTPRLRVLGTVQDGGLPHAACPCDRCNAARHDPLRKRHVASLALIIPSAHDADSHASVILIDATPDIRAQLDMLADVRHPPMGRVDRAPVDGVLLTHAHMGHYLGLAHFGFEAVNTHDLPTYCSPRMARFLRTNGPWSQLVSMNNIALHEAPPGQSFKLSAALTITPIAVPHRDEFSDTLAFIIEGPNRTALYMPDTSPWRAWTTPLIDLLTDPARPIDLFIVDGTFYGADELPGRDLSKIGHPLMLDTMNLLQPLVDAGSLKVFFTHLNHTNRALEPDSEARRTTESRGFAVLEEGAEFGL